MNNTLANIWLFATHWTKLDAFDTEEELNDELELLQRQSLPTKVRQVTDKEGREQFLLYVKQADRDYARYCTGWRPDQPLHGAGGRQRADLLRSYAAVAAAHPGGKQQRLPGI